MHHHTTLRAHLVERAEHGNAAVFEPSDDPPLVAFAEVFAATDLYSIDANKHLPEDQLSPLYELTVETLLASDAQPDILFRHWAPVFHGGNPLMGFRDGGDSALWGSSPVAFMPPDERTAALLLLVTTDYVHLSASREQSPPLVRGAINERTEEFRYVTLGEPDEA